MSGSLAHDLNDDLSRAGPCIEIENDNVLPSPQKQLIVGKRNGERLSLDLASQVTVGVIFPGVSGVMLPGGVCRNQTGPDGFSVGAQAGLILDDQDRSGGMFHEYRDNAGLYGCGGKKPTDGLGDVFNLRMALHRDRKRVSEDGHRFLPGVLFI